MQYGHQGRHMLCCQELEAIIKNIPNVLCERISQLIWSNHQCTNMQSLNSSFTRWWHYVHPHFEWDLIIWEVNGTLTNQTKSDQVIWYSSIRRPVKQDLVVWYWPWRTVHTIQDGGNNIIIWHLCAIIQQVRKICPYSLNRCWSQMRTRNVTMYRNMPYGDKVCVA